MRIPAVFSFKFAATNFALRGAETQRFEGKVRKFAAANLPAGPPGHPSNSSISKAGTPGLRRIWGMGKLLIGDYLHHLQKQSTQEDVAMHGTQ
jgi:hypothetical protein